MEAEQLCTWIYPAERVLLFGMRNLDYYRRELLNITVVENASISRWSRGCCDAEGGFAVNFTDASCFCSPVIEIILEDASTYCQRLQSLVKR